MPLSEEQLYAKGHIALRGRIDHMLSEAKRQIKSMREHYETGHNGTHPVPEKNSPLDMFYRVMGDQVMELQFLRNMAPTQFDRMELLYWVQSGLVFATVREDIKWAQFEKDILAGLDAFVARQVAELESPKFRHMVVQAGEMIAKVEAVTGRSPFEKQ